MKKIWFILSILGLMNMAQAEQTLQKLNNITVKDGDTISATINDEKVKIRLSGIDCYETKPNLRIYKQAYLSKMSVEETMQRGKNSKNILQNYIDKNKNNIYLKPDKMDMYGRLLGSIFSDHENINKYMLQNGGCFIYGKENQMQQKQDITWVVSSDLNALLQENQILVIETENNKPTGNAKIVSRDQITTEDEKLRAELQKKPLIVLINKEAVHYNLK